MLVTRFQQDFFQQVADVKTILDALDRISGAMFMIKNLDSRYIYMSRALCEAIHLAPDQEVVGKSDFDLFPRMIAETFRQNDLLVFQEGRTLLNEVHASAYFSGPTKWFLSSKFPLYNSARQVIGLITINHPYDEIMGDDTELNQLLPAIEHITRRYADKISIGVLARRCGLSESHFMRVFKLRMKMTAHAFLEQVRMYHALTAIKHGATPIAAIAHHCGFYDHSSFVKRFKTLTGTTPLRYRREYQMRICDQQPKVLPVLQDPF